jgi:PAS domain S-box-containing protein
MKRKLGSVTVVVSIMGLTLAFGILFWVADSAYEYIYFDKNLHHMIFQEPLTFGDSLLWNIPAHAVFTRLAFLLACLVGGALVSTYVVLRRRAEAALHDREARLQAIFDNAAVGVALADRSGRFLQVNRYLVEKLGYTEEEFRAMTVYDLTYEDDKELTRTNYGSLVEGQSDHYEYEKRYVAKDGEPIWFTFSVSPICDAHDSVDYVIGVILDITERKQMERRLRQSEKMDAIGQLAGGVAHDFNNQLSGIMGYADMLANRLDDEKLRTYAENIKRASRRSADLTGQLLAFARRGQYMRVPVDIHRTILEVVSLLEHSLDKRIDIEQWLRAHPSTTEGDPTQLQNALLNLAINARDAMPEGGRLIFATETVDLDPADCAELPQPVDPGHYLRVTVRDTGSGMDEATRTRIFEPFYTTKPRGKGTGMGLPAVYGTVKNHGGAVAVDSEPNKGSAFHLYLPLVDSEAESDEDAETEPPATRSLRVMVVDDEPMVRDMVRDILEADGHEVTACEDGQEAVALFEKAPHKYDLAILDMVMPRMNGAETYRALRRIRPDVTAILSSGYSIDHQAQSLMSEGVAGFIQKPFESDRLLKLIGEVLAQEGDETVKR